MFENFLASYYIENLSTTKIFMDIRLFINYYYYYYQWRIRGMGPRGSDSPLFLDPTKARRLIYREREGERASFPGDTPPLFRVLDQRPLNTVQTFSVWSTCALQTTVLSKSHDVTMSRCQLHKRIKVCRQNELNNGLEKRAPVLKKGAK